MTGLQTKPFHGGEGLFLSDVAVAPEKAGHKFVMTFDILRDTNFTST